MHPRPARILLFGIVLATLLCVASGHRPKQPMPAPLQTSAVRCGMEAPDFECSVDRRAAAPDGGHLDERNPLFGLAANGLDLPLPAFHVVAPGKAALAALSAAPHLTLLRARAPPVSCG